VSDFRHEFYADYLDFKLDWQGAPSSGFAAYSPKIKLLADLQKGSRVLEIGLDVFIPVSLVGLALLSLVFACVVLLGPCIAFGIFAHPNLTLAQAICPWIVATAIFLSGVLSVPLRVAKLLNTGCCRYAAR
jgi:hypothetical protein